MQDDERGRPRAIDRSIGLAANLLAPRSLVPVPRIENKPMSQTMTSGAAEPKGVTFRGRGYARLLGTRLSLLICPHCSQRNAPKAVDKGYCNWCTYEPSREDIEPAG